MSAPSLEDKHIECLTKLIESVAALSTKIDGFNEVKEIQNTMRKELIAHIADETAMFTRAFPDGDPDGHRRAHEARIKEAEAKAEFWQRMRIKAGEMTVYAFLICVVAVTAFYWNGHMPTSAQINIPGAK